MDAMLILIVILAMFGLVLLLAIDQLLHYAVARRRAGRFYDRPGHPRDDGVRIDLGTVPALRVLPLIDGQAARDDLETQPGVAYWVQAGGTIVLFDLGLGPAGTEGSPLLRNMARLKVDPAAADLVLISHPHDDHTGGFKSRFARRAGISSDNAPLAGKFVYSTVPLDAAPGRNVVVEQPCLLAPGVASTGPVPVGLFLLGYTLEQALVVHVAGKGLVLVVGCGHPGVEALVERAEQAFAAPLYGVIGGLHLPVGGESARLRLGQVLGTPNPPWQPLGPATVQRTISYLKGKGVQLVSLSTHDSSDWTVRAFGEAFGDRYHPLRVGEEITIEGDLP